MCWSVAPACNSRFESLIGNRLRDTDLHNPDLDDQHLSATRALQELERIRQVTFTAGGDTPSPP